MISGRSFIVTATTLIGVEKGEVVIMSNNDYQSYKVTPLEVEYAQAMEWSDEWFSLQDKIERLSEEVELIDFEEKEEEEEDD